MFLKKFEYAESKKGFPISNLINFFMQILYMLL